ncbi:MAG: PEP/pyruvate-binding domain-containing protein [Gammaproteobacteria bacterium]|nr:PEP/pyruvate-binding domain-containing protein [Gammaproteobacteria bacterium]
MIRQRLLLFGIALCASYAPLATAAPSNSEIDARHVARSWIQEMKKARKGPFRRIRWYCNDGTILPPKPFACRKHGGGVQHGEWNKRTLALRGEGYYIANVLADLDVEKFPERKDALPLLKSILVEQFLREADDGWIFRRARFYRGALQAEDESGRSLELLNTLLGIPIWRHERFILLREAVRLLPYMGQSPLITQVRQMSSNLAAEDRGFTLLRNKIHAKPDSGDATRVRNYQQQKAPKDLHEDYNDLVAVLDELYQPGGFTTQLDNLAKMVKDSAVKAALKASAKQLEGVNDPIEQLKLGGWLMLMIRETMDLMGSTKAMYNSLQTSRVLEQKVYVAGNVLLENLSKSNRSQRLKWMDHSLAALYGSGMLSKRQWAAARASLSRLQKKNLPLDVYKKELDYLQNVPAWVAQGLGFHFNDVVSHLADIEPLAYHYTQDRMRGSPLLFFAEVLDTLVKDLNQLAGLKHTFFGKTLGVGLQRLNPGLARGTLRIKAHENMSKFQRDSIYLLPVTTPDLPPVAGVLTQGAGNSLSHVQLLARNLGIPNIVVDDYLIRELEKEDGKKVVLAASAGGVVNLVEDGPEWDKIFGGEDVTEDVVIRPDLEKLDLEKKELILLSELRATDAGRTVGPKAANLGELKHFFPETVTEGLVIPFGIFRDLLDQPTREGGNTVFQTLQFQYNLINATSNDVDVRLTQSRDLLTWLRNWIKTSDPGQQFRDKLKIGMEQAFGKEGSYGVFVRSDTNVEDLPGFTGAGLNLTVPNVVGFDNIYDAILRVWASPFTERAYSWRQAYMTEPEHVYPSILLLRSVDADKSGVMVTQDLDTGDRNTLSVSINEGVGGAVDGQGSEQLRINTKTADVTLIAQASEPMRRKISATGGVIKVPASGTSEVLKELEVEQLIALSKDVEKRFTKIRDADGNPTAADIEFGFLDGKLVLFQIRPFVQSKKAKFSKYLNELDKSLADLSSITVNLNEIPRNAQ